MITARAPMADRGTPVYWEAMSAQPHDSYVRTLFHPEHEQLPTAEPVVVAVVAEDFPALFRAAGQTMGKALAGMGRALAGPALVLDPADWSVSEVDWPTPTGEHDRTDLQYATAGVLLAEHGTLTPYRELDTGSLTVSAIALEAAEARQGAALAALQASPWARQDGPTE